MGVFVPTRGPHKFQTLAIGSEYSMYVGWREGRRGGREKRGEKKRGKLSAQNEMQHDRIVQFGLLFAFFLLSLLKVALHACCLLFFLSAPVPLH